MPLITDTRGYLNCLEVKTEHRRNKQSIPRIPFSVLFSQIQKPVSCKNSPYNRSRSPRGGVELKFYSFFDLGTRCGWVANATPRPLYPWEKTRYLLWTPETVWTGAEILPPTGFRSPDRPAQSESQYRLRYPGLQLLSCTIFNISLCCVL